MIIDINKNILFFKLIDFIFVRVNEIICLIQVLYLFVEDRCFGN